MRLFTLLLLAPLLVQAQSFRSVDQPAQLVELFTSQGCSSCPPAERWLNELKHSAHLWQSLFPVAWHVDYWDYLGWKDPFAQPDFTLRQYRYHHQGSTSGVYTPQALVDGREWRALLASPRPALPEPALAPALAFEISLTQDRFSAVSQTPRGLLNIALLGMDLGVRVRRGENAGRVLDQEFVVLAFGQYPLTDQGWHGQLPALAADQEARALVAWISEPGESGHLAIAGGRLPEKTSQ